MIQELISNKGNGGTYCEGVLGSTPKRDEIASFFQKSAGLVHLIAVNALIEYTEEESFNKEELEAFKKGLAAIGTFMSKCSAERAQEVQKLKQQG